MKVLVLICIILHCSIDFIESTGFDEDYINLIMENAWKTNEKMTNFTAEPRSLKDFFYCNTFVSTSPRPTNVHALRPNDIEYIGAVGDSLTAANGAKASTILGLIEECRGVSWSMGGERPDLSESITLPNIIKKFNPNLYGASTGSGGSTSVNAVFNMARPGETSFEMLAQAKNLVYKMKQTSGINFSQGWKLVTMFVGGNDLCKACRDSKYTAANYMKNIRAALDYLKANLPRTLVNLVVSLDVSGIEILTGLTCRNMQKTFCDCGLSSSFRPSLLSFTQEIQQQTEDLIHSGVYDTSEDFTVVAHPFMKNMRPPTKPDGSGDYSYFAPDCFHFSIKGHEAAAVELWNSMLTPVGKKSDKWASLNQAIRCPSSDSPFIFTNKNSPNILKNLLKNY
ncbi:phospholipase membrane-associated-like [Brachionus plicatilis]|uniref:Phospholipase B1, membrane-associated n=1 Tax=Brachionus plicatilis TaxID=10195 RepID=A0A3M7RLL2_BRAPC|nr:phospholipase membrane-associated-like [Brachionus plicatilis]